MHLAWYCLSNDTKIIIFGSKLTEKLGMESPFNIELKGRSIQQGWLGERGPKSVESAIRVHAGFAKTFSRTFLDFPGPVHLTNMR